jgi:hypothetical protein
LLRLSASRCIGRCLELLSLALSLEALGSLLQESGFFLDQIRIGDRIIALESMDRFIDAATAASRQVLMLGA